MGWDNSTSVFVEFSSQKVGIKMAVSIMDKDFTRSLFTINATGFVIDGIDYKTLTVKATPVSIEFVSTVKDDLKLATALMREQHPRVDVDSIHIDKCTADVYAMSIGEFIKHARKVERGANGRVKELDA